MNTLSTGEASQAEAATLPMRPAGQVMDLERLGSLHQSRLSFMRALVRRIMRERWRMDASRFELDADGHGTAIYRIHTPNGLFSFVLFSQYLAPEKRNDRVIASEWDLTMALCEGEVDPTSWTACAATCPCRKPAGWTPARWCCRAPTGRAQLRLCRGRAGPGRQPDAARITRVGYLYRTTAVYGSGKLGMADWEKIRDRHPDFARPFAAEMFTCFMLRNFSLRQAEHIARHRAPATAVALEPALKRYFGIGNSTGLGMAPYLINHPQLISRWVEMRELALARIVAAPAPPPRARTTAAAAGPRHPPSPGDPYRGRMADRQQPAHPRGHAGPVRLAGRRAAGILESAAGVGDAPLQPAGPGTAQLHPAGTAPGAGG